MTNFWTKLKKPFYILAPMEDVTDTVFRRIVADCGRPDVFFTEFTNVAGICSDGAMNVGQRLLFTEEERPLVAQIWGMKPEQFKETARKLVEMGFDGIDINMGCPERSVTKQGACSALIKNPTLAAEIIQAVKEGAPDLPLSVKTRIGYSQIQTEEWIGFLLQQNLDALTVHGRTTAEMSKVPAHWDEIGKSVTLRNQISPTTLIIGNGDIESLAQAKEMVEKYQVDGVMIGRGIFKNPWLFNPAIDIENVSIRQRLELLVHHVRLYDEVWGKTKNFQVLKKFFKIYVSNFDGASDLRVKLMETRTATEVYQIIDVYLSHN
jgi:nifR3 family TIM-barrel protein